MARTPSARRVAFAGLIIASSFGIWTVARASSSAAQTPMPLPDTTSPEPLPVSAAPPPQLKTSQPNPCRHNSHDQLVIVSIAQQREWACERHTVMQNAPVTTGASRHGDATPRGTFAVQGMIRNTTLAGSYHVGYWIPFHLGVWGFHDASWQRIPYGAPSYRTHGSHGCVHMPLPAIRWLFHWVHYGTLVRIR